MLGPLGEAVGVEGELALEVLDDVLVLEEEDGAVAAGEALDAALGRGELLRGHDALEHVQGDVPQLLALIAKEEDSLRMEKVRRGQNCVLSAIEGAEYDIHGCSGC